MTITYRTIEGVQGKYFDCPSGMGMLSADSCGKAYREAMSQLGLREGRRVTCRACHIGALHSGAPAGATNSRFLGSLCCARCHVGARRLIRNSICVSCYNREREMLIGKNAKGNAPIHGKHIRSVMVMCFTEKLKKVRIQKADRVTGYLEVMLSTIRVESSSVSFGWCRGRNSAA